MKIPMHVTISFECAKLMTAWSPHVVSHPSHCAKMLTPETLDKGEVALRFKAKELHELLVGLQGSL